MNSRTLKKYTLLGVPMKPGEFCDIQQELDLSNQDMAGLLGCSNKTVESYRRKGVPWGVAGFLRMVLDDYRRRVRNRKCATEYYYRNNTQSRRKNLATANRFRGNNPDRTREYNRAYGRFRRTGDRSLLEHWEKKWNDKK